MCRDNRPRVNHGQAVEILKRDALGRVERVVLDGGVVCVRRVACGGRIPGSGVVARMLLARERRALEALAAVDGVPKLVSDAARGDVLLRSWIDGEPLHQVDRLPEDFFDHLDALVARLHAEGVCHNDLHKEQNILVARDGYPCLVDFQLASRHTSGSRLFASRTREDLRHVEKHRRRYARRGDFDRDPSTLPRGSGHGLRRSLLAWMWRRGAKPVYQFVTRKLLRTRDGESRRATSGPWPAMTPPLGKTRSRGVT